jgi:LacI family transcriptional regulator
MEDQGCAGAIIWYIGGSDNLDLLAEVSESGFPLVFVDRIPDSIPAADFVGSDNIGAACEAVTHLLDLGHRRIACLTNLDHASSVIERIEGWREAHARAGVPLDERLLINPHESPVEAPDDFWIEDQVKRMLRLPDPATAAFCINDTLAVNAMEFIAKQGIRIPEDFSVVGFDGLLSWMPNGGGLTSSVQNFERIGQTAFRLLKSRMARPTLPARHVLVDAPLRQYGSTAKLTPRPDTAPSGQITHKQ